MDEKFEQALHEVSTSIDEYVGIVNETSSKQYEDFNQNLKQAFAKNLEVVQEMITTLHEAQEKEKARLNALEIELNEVDTKGKKSVEKLNDKVEVERCVTEMVGWIAESLTNQQMVDNLNSVAKKISGDQMEI